MPEKAALSFSAFLISAALTYGFTRVFHEARALVVRA